MQTNSIIELSRSAYQNNIDFLKQLFGKKRILSSVVKGNAYGHGISEFVAMAYGCGINHFSVFDADEARQVHAVLSDKVTILIMGFLSEEDLPWIIENDIEFFVFDKKRLVSASRIAKKIHKKAIVHIEIETGMNRTGFEKSELKEIITILKKDADSLIFKGLCTHYAGAESIANYYRVEKQIKYFEEIHQYLIKNELKPEIVHSACSAAAIMFPATRMNLVRVGIMQYGLWPSQEVFVAYINSKKIKQDPLRRIITWKSTVMSLKKVKSGDFIGYGTSFMAKKNMKIAVIPIGYAHGYSRSLSNHGRILIQGQRCMVVGLVTMNMVAVDVTDINSVKKEEEVVLIGNQNDLAITIASFCDYSNQLNYELLTRISKTIPRKITD
ncbi:alanine racemase [Flavobacterium flevense]|uniref:Alanine racemase n=1 Tax=Flavobacterium flevense TaxID=983 RepID=A0A4Y4AYQ7_9FLAO|nr:alanine racemase [Flavobacterium flevense]GEC72282.1 alanine racemase [Flavobacterium flevense]SHL66306.1 alanine racemase [Flavobacterium flevense]